MTSLTLANGLTQTLTWDAFNRPVKISQRDGSGNGYDWTAVYDGLGRRISTTHQPVTAGTANGSATVMSSLFDPQVEFLEIGVSLNGANAWKVYGPDLNGRFGGLQGTGGLEATIVDSSRATKGVINDRFGNVVAAISGSTVTWSATHMGAYGPLPGYTMEVLADITRLAEVSVWGGRRADPTGNVNFGSRIYNLRTQRWISTDPMGHASSPSLYDFCNGDPVNNFDPDGRCSGTFTSDAAQQAMSLEGLREKFMAGGFEPSGHVYLPPYSPSADAYEAYIAAISNSFSIQNYLQYSKNFTPFFDNDSISQGSGAGVALLFAPELPFVGAATNWIKGLFGKTATETAGTFAANTTNIVTAYDGATASAVPNALRAGQLAEGPALNAIGSTGKVVFTPTAEQINSAAFKVIVGDAQYTLTGAPVSTIYDGTTGAGLAEIKSGSSVLNSSYQLRLQTYGSLISEQPFSIYTSRPLNAQFGGYLNRWGVSVKPLP